MTLIGSDDPSSTFVWESSPFNLNETSYALSTMGETGVRIQVTPKDESLVVYATKDETDYPIGPGNNWTSDRIDLNTNDIITNIAVTTEYGDLTRTYYLSITRNLSPNIDVGAVSIDGSDVPMDSDGFFYHGVAPGTTSVNIEVTPSDSFASADINNTGSDDITYALTPGQVNSVDFTVTAENGDEETYTIKIYEELDSTLSDLMIGGTTIMGFNSVLHSYDLTVGPDTDSIVVAAVPKDASATMVLLPSGSVLTSGDDSSPVSLTIGQTTTVSVRCTNYGESGTFDDSETTYILHIYRQPAWTSLGGNTVYDGEIYRGEIHEYNGTLYSMVVHQGDWGIQDTSVMSYNPLTDSWDVLGDYQNVDGSFYTTMTIDPVDGSLYILSGMNVYTWNGLSWNQVGGLIGETGTGQTYGIAVDPSTGYLYVAYADWGATATAADKKQYLTVKTCDPGAVTPAWSIVGPEACSEDEIDETKPFFFNGSLYVIAGGTDLDYRLYKWTGTVWETADSVVSSWIQDVNVAVDGSNGVYLGYCEGGSTTTAPSVRYFNGTSGTQIGDPQFAPPHGYHIALAVNPDTGTVFAGYQTGNDDDDSVMVSYWNGSTWTDLPEIDSFDTMSHMTMVTIGTDLYVGYGDADLDQYMVVK